jgi:hypothetical protein
MAKRVEIYTPRHTAHRGLTNLILVSYDHYSVWSADNFGRYGTPERSLPRMSWGWSYHSDYTNGGDRHPTMLTYGSGSA